MEMSAKTNCPLDKFKPCKQLDCAWFIKVSGRHPQQDKVVDEWGCAMVWMPIMLVENAQQQRQTGAAVESFRNEMVKANEAAPYLLTNNRGALCG